MTFTDVFVDDGRAEKTLIVWRDINYAVRWWGSQTMITFDVHRINGWEAHDVNGAWCGTKGMPDGGCLELKDANAGTDTAASIDAAAVYVHGMIKWDGCSHLSFPASAECMTHICGVGGWVDWITLMQRLMALGPTIPKWDKENCR